MEGRIIYISQLPAGMIVDMPQNRLPLGELSPDIVVASDNTFGNLCVASTSISSYIAPYMIMLSIRKIIWRRASLCLLIYRSKRIKHLCRKTGRELNSVSSDVCPAPCFLS